MIEKSDVPLSFFSPSPAQENVPQSSADSQSIPNTPHPQTPQILDNPALTREFKITADGRYVALPVRLMDSYAAEALSDFGTMASVHRVDGTNVTPADTARVKRAAKDLVIGPGDRLSDFADFELRFGVSSSAEGVDGVMVGLTEYMVEDQPRNGGLDDEAVIARDRPLAEQFGEELRALLGRDYTVSVYCGFW